MDTLQDTFPAVQIHAAKCRSASVFLALGVLLLPLAGRGLVWVARDLSGRGVGHEENKTDLVLQGMRIAEAS